MRPPIGLSTQGSGADAEDIVCLGQVTETIADEGCEPPVKFGWAFLEQPALWFFWLDSGENFNTDKPYFGDGVEKLL